MTSDTQSFGSDASRKRPAPDSDLPRARAKRRKRLNALTDVEAWEASDEEIIGQY
jgi:hypothetical protein